MGTTYDETFFVGHASGSRRSASIVVPLILRHFGIHSVADLGCGVGAWLEEFVQHGIDDYFGFDGDHVPRHLLRIPEDRFLPCDLAQLSKPSRRFDLACSLEVAEHLPEAAAPRFIALLTEFAPVVLFSAAIPGQRGTGHINEQWQSYWGSLFANCGYVGVDCIRPFVANDPRVEPWYRQNAIVFCEPKKVPDGLPVMSLPYDFDRIDPAIWSARCSEAERRPHGSLRKLFRSPAR